MTLRRLIPPLVLTLSIALFIAALLFATRPLPASPTGRALVGSPTAITAPASTPTPIAPPQDPTTPAISLPVPPTLAVPSPRSSPTVAPPVVSHIATVPGEVVGTAPAPAPTPGAVGGGAEPTPIPPPVPPPPTLAPPVPTRTPPAPLEPTPTVAPVVPPIPPTATPRPTPGPSAAAGARPPAAVPPATIGLPVRLLIPTLDIDAAIERVSTDTEGNMATPSDPWNTAWFAPGNRPGQPGNAAIAGHVDYRNVGPVVFWDLRTLAPGAEILVVTEDGLTLRFVVHDSAYFRPESAPLARIFGPSADVNLNVITCGGTFNPATRQYDQRLVVFATFTGSGR